MIEKNYGDGQPDDRLMPVGWPLHLEEAVRQLCASLHNSSRRLTKFLEDYDLKRDLLELNEKASQWKTPAEASPRRQNVLTQRQREAHGDSKLYNAIAVPTGLNFK